MISFVRPSLSLSLARFSVANERNAHAELGIDYHEGGELQRAAWCFEQSAKRNGGCGAGMLMYGCVIVPCSRWFGSSFATDSLLRPLPGLHYDTVGYAFLLFPPLPSPR